MSMGIKAKYLSGNLEIGITDRSKTVVLLWFSVACFWCQRFDDVSPYVCSYYFSSGKGAERPHFGKDLLTRFNICSLCMLTICNSSYFPFLVLRAE